MEKQKKASMPWKWLQSKQWKTKRCCERDFKTYTDTWAQLQKGNSHFTGIESSLDCVSVCTNSFHKLLLLLVPFWQTGSNLCLPHMHIFAQKRRMHLSISFIICTSNNEFNTKIKFQDCVFMLTRRFEMWNAFTHSIRFRLCVVFPSNYITTINRNVSFHLCATEPIVDTHFHFGVSSKSI